LSLIVAAVWRIVSPWHNKNHSREPRFAVRFELLELRGNVPVLAETLSDCGSPCGRGVLQFLATAQQSKNLVSVRV
jgi:hypothetical protein